jgi:hypothetical protein
MIIVADTELILSKTLYHPDNSRRLAFFACHAHSHRLEAQSLPTKGFLLPAMSGAGFNKKQTLSEVNPCPPPHKMQVSTACRARKFVISSEAAAGRIVRPLQAAVPASANIENVHPPNPVYELARDRSLESEVERLSDMLIQEQMLNQALITERKTLQIDEDAVKELQKRRESAELALLRYQSEQKEREDQLVAVIAELDSARLINLKECEELKALLSIERERSAEAAVDREAHEVESKRRREELEQSLQEAREQSGNTSRQLAIVQANNSILTAQLRESGVALEERCASLAASVHAAEQEHRAVQQRLEEAVSDVVVVASNTLQILSSPLQHGQCHVNGHRNSFLIATASQTDVAPVQLDVDLQRYRR